MRWLITIGSGRFSVLSLFHCVSLSLGLKGSQESRPTEAEQIVPFSYDCRLFEKRTSDESFSDASWTIRSKKNERWWGFGRTDTSTVDPAAATAHRPQTSALRPPMIPSSFLCFVFLGVGGAAASAGAAGIKSVERGSVGQKPVKKPGPADAVRDAARQNLYLILLTINSMSKLLRTLRKSVKNLRLEGNIQH